MCQSMPRSGRVVGIPDKGTGIRCSGGFLRVVRDSLMVGKRKATTHY
jgi:hypothetical protein